ncbi:hypothetical protein PoHVEF18_004115 [Penicillium ochrochloron]
MTLSIQVQHYWDSAICAFRPIRVNEEKTSMEIAFHWLPLPLTDVNRAELVPTQKHPYPDQRQGFGYSPREDGPMFLFHRETGQEIPSGYIFTVTTSDPVARPLPSMELLELRWHLARIVATQGALKDEDMDLNPEEDEHGCLDSRDDGDRYLHSDGAEDSGLESEDDEDSNLNSDNDEDSELGSNDDEDSGLNSNDDGHSDLDSDKDWVIVRFGSP